MKVLYFHQHFSTPKGSTGTRSYEMAKELIKREHQVTMVCGRGFLADSGLTGEARKGFRRGVVDGIDVVEINLPYSNYDSLTKRAGVFLRYAVKSVYIAWRENYDLIFATSTPLTASIPGIGAQFLWPGKPFIFEVRDLWPELPKAMGVINNRLILACLSLLEKLSYLSMNAGVALSPGIKKGMAKRSASGKEIAMIPNGCDLKMFFPSGPKKNRDDDIPIQLPKSGLNAIFTGAHGLANGLDAVLDAAGVLKKKGREDINFLFVGDGKEKPQLIRRSVEQELDNCFFYSPIAKTELVKMLRCMDIGLMILANIPAFYYGTSPNKFFDYIASGLPVLNNYPGWLADLIQENDCGIAVPPGSPVVFAEALIELADNPDKRREMGRHARELAETMFSREKLASQFVDFLEKVEKSSSRRCSWVGG